MNKISYVEIGGKKCPLIHCLKSEQKIEEIWGSRENMIDAFGETDETSVVELLVNIVKGLAVMNKTALQYSEIFDVELDEDASKEPLNEEKLLMLYSTNDISELIDTYVNAISVSAEKETEVIDNTNEEKNRKSLQK